jgi:hypothetical protein
MRVGTLIELGLLAVLSGCAGNQTTVGSSVGEASATSDAASPAASEAAKPDIKGEPTEATTLPGAKKNEPEPPPPPDPALVKALVEKTGEAPSLDNPLHLRLEVTPRPAGELWLVAVVNRGTEPAKVLFDLRRLTLSLEAAEPTKPRPKWQKKPAPVVCKLPEGFGGRLLEDPMRTLQPGEGLLQTFDPRLYCISPAGESRLKTGQRVTAKLGFTPKPPRVLWKQGKRTEVPALQSAPFIAEPSSTEPASLESVSPKLDPEHDPRVKELAATELTLTPDLMGTEAEEDPTLPLQLRLVRGSDSATELTTTAVVEVKAKQKSMLYFRRELVSFTVHGPDGIHECDPQPDDRAPDRQAYTTLGAGQSVSATSLLTELCPKYTFGRPGLYLVSARLDAVRDGAEFGLAAFTGRLESRREALVRIRTGDFPALPPAEPLLVKVGQ